MLISKHFDPVLGIDIHILVIPPTGPIPIPHPHIALIFDVIDYLPIFGATVKVGGLPRSVAGSPGLSIPHFPLGGPFVKPPMNEEEILMGSTTVLADGSPLSFTALPTLSCHDIGIIAPPRMKKPRKSFGMLLPTSVVISIPLGRPVLVGGAPTIDKVGLLAGFGFAALGPAFSLLRKNPKIGDRIRIISDKIHDRAANAMATLKVPPCIRNAVHTGICTVTGHPVDVASGKMFTDHIDFSLPGPLPLEWQRIWYSTSVYDGPLGHGWHHSYDVKLCEMNNAVAVRLADGRPVAFPALNINETCFHRQERLTLRRDAEGYAMDTSDRKRYRFTPFEGQTDNQLLVSLSDTTSGAKIEFFYNDKAQLTHIVDSGGRLIRLTYTEDNFIHQIFLPEPESNITRDHTNPTFFCAVEYHYRDGMLIQVDDALQQPLQYEYDHTLLVKETFRSGLSFYFQYDGLDHNARCVRTWGDEGIYWRQLHYDLENNITYVKNSLGHITTYHHNGVVPHKVVDPLGHESFTQFNENYEIVCETNELGYKTYYEYNEFGHGTKITKPDGSSIQLAFDEHQNLVEVIDQSGSCWRYEHDEFNRLTKKINPKGDAIRYEYSGSLLSSVIDPAGNQLHFKYDQNNNLRSISDGQVEQLSLEHDAWGNLVASRDNRGNWRRLHYDKLGRVKKVDEPDGNTRLFAYDAAGNVIHTRDEHGDVQLSYCGMGRPSSRTQAGTTVRFEYNREEQLTAILNEHDRIYQFDYNARGEIIRESGFDGAVRQYLLDPLGRATRINRAAHRHSLYKYNVSNQVTDIIHSDGSRKHYEYNKNGEIIQAANDSLTLKFEWDVLGRLIKEHQGDFWVASEYDTLGYRTRVQSSLGLDQKITRNHRGDVVNISTGAAQYEIDFKRDAQGLELERSLPGGIQSRWSRDKLGRPLRHDISQCKTTHSSKNYVWGLNNRLLKLIDGFNRETVYQHDALGNLLSARYSDGTFDLRLPDAVNNLFKTHSQKDREYGPAGQLLAVHTSKGTTRYQYDEEGNLITKLEPGDKLWRYEWNGSGMLAKVVRPDGKIVEFEYDALGRRIRKSFDNKITRWVWDGNNPLHEWVEYISGQVAPQKNLTQQQMIAEDVRAGKRKQLLQVIEPQGPPVFNEGTIDSPVTWLFDPESFAPMAKLIGDERYSIITDHIGTPLVMFDDKGEQVWSGEIDVWGKVRKLRGEKEFCPFRFAGQYEDGETGLYYNRFRYYDPEAGQYIRQDPIGLDGGMRLYGYVNDPTTWIDPLGLSKRPPNTNGNGHGARGSGCPPGAGGGSGGGASIKGRLKAAQLPTTGRIRYVPPAGYEPSMPLPRGPSKGYMDRFGNEWVRGPSRTEGQAFEWDVQLSRTGRQKIGWLTRDGSHANVSLDGRVTHR